MAKKGKNKKAKKSNAISAAKKDIAADKNSLKPKENADKSELITVENSLKPKESTDEPESITVENSLKPKESTDESELITEENSAEISVKLPSRGARRWAAPIGFATIFLAIVGIATIVVLSVLTARRSKDLNPLRLEIEKFLHPVILYAPSEFETPKHQQQDALLLATIWKITNDEKVRQEKEKTTKSVYKFDDLGRYIIPVSEVEEAYKFLFGDESVIYNHSINEEDSPFGLKYDRQSGNYYVPVSPVQSLYTPLTGNISQEKETVAMEVSFVPSNKIVTDENGNLQISKDMAEYKQLYTLEKKNDGWVLLSVKDIDSSKPSVATTTPPSETTLPSEAIDDSLSDELTTTTT